MNFKNTICAAAAAVTLGAAPAFAGSITVSEFDATAFDILNGLGTFTEQDFETLGANNGEGEVGPSLSTNVGTFTSAGGTGTGGTVTNLAGNSGTELTLRDGSVFGRTNTVPTAGSWFLDSNDTFGIEWEVGLAGDEAFDSLFFTLTDGSDTGAYLRITTATDTFEQRVGGALANGNSSIVVIGFGDTAIDNALIELINYEADGVTKRTNDGFSLDGMRVGLSDDLNAAPIPLPASGLLLMGALGFVGWRARKNRG